MSVDRWRIYEIKADYTHEYKKLDVEAWNRDNLDDEESEDEADCYYSDAKDASVRREAFVRNRRLEKERKRTRPGMMGDSMFSSTSSDRGAAPLG